MWCLEFSINITTKTKLSIIYKTKNKEIMVSCFGQVGVCMYKDGRISRLIAN